MFNSRTVGVGYPGWFISPPPSCIQHDFHFAFMRIILYGGFKGKFSHKNTTAILFKNPCDTILLILNRIDQNSVLLPSTRGLPENGY